MPEEKLNYRRCGAWSSITYKAYSALMSRVKEIAPEVDFDNDEMEDFRISLIENVKASIGEFWATKEKISTQTLSCCLGDRADYLYALGDDSQDRLASELSFMSLMLYELSGSREERLARIEKRKIDR